uniref:Apolipoprotein(A)-like n=1 Tax=Saccoglossus kowalevskii TaxID=10224 RepID=A0ABM0MVJ1_SACKO|nr:PREDICTED: apolipoprotein(a)-like [Saccoglossus kowalevskii]
MTLKERTVPDGFFPIFLAVFFLLVFIAAVAIIIEERIATKKTNEEQDFTECYEDLRGRDYRGMVNTSANGYDCRNWDELDDRSWVTPENFPGAGLGDHNYCRNPDNDFTPWCYVNHMSLRWDFCEVSDPRENCKVSECFADADGGDYRGTVNTTVNGYGCQMWTSQSPHVHVYTPSNYPGSGVGDHNFCRNPDGKASAWCYTKTPSIPWQHCDIGVAGEHCEFTECYEDPKGRDYRGMVNTSANGYDCLNWDELDNRYWITPENFPDAGLGDHNYCRNPDNDLTPWCYVDNIIIGWDFCEVSDPREDCSVTTVAPPHIPTSMLTITIVPELSECFGNADGGDYRGSVNTTVNGYGCQMWTSQIPHVHVYTPSNYPGSGVGDHNFCRNPDGRATAWCYTTESSIPWDADGGDYRGSVDHTINGYGCQMWTSQSPHVHVYTPSNYPDSGVGDHNFCRNPDERATAWCYTTNPSIPWQHCDIGMAGENCANKIMNSLVVTNLVGIGIGQSIQVEGRIKIKLKRKTM